MTRSALGTYAAALDILEEAVHRLIRQVPAATLASVKGNMLGPRFVEKSLEQAIIQKMARTVSSLRAACLLHSNGFLQEQAAVQRMVDEASEDVVFLAYGAINGLSSLHDDFLKNFYLEEYEDPAKPIETKIPRSQIRRSKIQAYIVRAQGVNLDTSGADAAMQSIHRTYSGYVHGASPHIMEMYSPLEHRFEMNGCRNAMLRLGHQDDLWNYVCRAIGSFVVAAHAMKDASLFNELYASFKAFEATQPR